MIVGITISCGSFVFSQSRVKVSTSLTNVGSLAVGAFDLVDYSLSVVRVVPGTDQLERQGQTQQHHNIID